MGARVEDYQLLFNIAVGLSGALGGFLLASISKYIDKVDKKVEQVDKDVRSIPLTYVSKADMRIIVDDLRADVKDGFDRIERNFAVVFSKLDGKEDKSASVGRSSK